MRVWWCNQGKPENWHNEREKEVVCAQEADNNTLRRTVLGVKEGDIIVHYRKQKRAIVAVSVAQSDGERCPARGKKDLCLYGKGWAVRTKYHVFEAPIEVPPLAAKLARLDLTNKPVMRLGDGSYRVRQAYFMPFSVEGLNILREGAGDQKWPASASSRRSTIKSISAEDPIAPDTARERPFNPTSLKDARREIERTIKERRGQRVFRNALLNAYELQCAISGCAIVDILEAAHIFPHLGPETNRVENGLLLRADIHTLFDCDLMAIEPATMKIAVSQVLMRSEYARFHGTRLRRPKSKYSAPSIQAFTARAKLKREIEQERRRRP